jgi:hypothetical protein
MMPLVLARALIEKKSTSATARAASINATGETSRLVFKSVAFCGERQDVPSLPKSLCDAEHSVAGRALPGFARRAFLNSSQLGSFEDSRHGAQLAGMARV